MLPAGWCSAPELGNGEGLDSSFPSHCYPQAGNQRHSFPLSSLSEGKEVKNAVLAWAALLRVPGSDSPKLV